MKLSYLEGKEYDVSDGLLSIQLAHHVDLESHILCVSIIEVTKSGKNFCVVPTSELYDLSDSIRGARQNIYAVTFLPEFFKDRINLLPEYEKERPVLYTPFNRPIETRHGGGIFLKDERFSSQREYRYQFQLSGEERKKDHAWLDIGNISHISGGTYIDFSDMSKSFDFFER